MERYLEVHLRVETAPSAMGVSVEKPDTVELHGRATILLQQEEIPSQSQ